MSELEVHAFDGLLIQSGGQEAECVPLQDRRDAVERERADEIVVVGRRQIDVGPGIPPVALQRFQAEAHLVIRKPFH